LAVSPDEISRLPPQVRSIPGVAYSGELTLGEGSEMGTWETPVVVGLDNGGTANNATVLDASGHFLVDRLVESPSLVREGPAVAVPALEQALHHVLTVTGVPREAVAAIGLDTPGPASADGVISSAGATNFANPAWRGFDFRGALEARLGVPVVYNNDGNAAALYAHYVHFGRDRATRTSSVAAIVGTGLGGGVISDGRVVKGVTGTGGEFGHVHIPMTGLLGEDQPEPRCNCGFAADVESVASLTGIEKNLLPYWLSRYPDHELHKAESIHQAAKLVRGLGERGDELALKIFEQQAMALGRLFTIAANFTDPDAYFVGGGVVEAAPEFRDWFLTKIREHTALRPEQILMTTFALVPDLDMAGARGAAIAAWDTIRR
jgi:glucokinase